MTTTARFIPHQTTSGGTQVGDSRLPERFWVKLKVTKSGCWEWTAFTNFGYGYFNFKGNNCRAHRVSYEALIGTIPTDKELDHLCRKKNCVNPAHLEPVDHAENVRRGKAGINQRRKTHCPRGHPYSGKNLSMRKRKKADGTITYGRACKACQKIADAKQYPKKKLRRRAKNAEKQ